MTEKIHELQRALDSDPTDREAFERLADRYAEAGDWRRLRWHFEEYAGQLDQEEAFSQLAFVLGELARAEEDPAEKAAILVALGDVLFEHLQSHEEGMDAYQRAFKAHPGDATSLERARRVYRRQGRFEQVLVLYDLQRDVCDDPEELAALSVKVAQVHGEHLGDREAAMAELQAAIDDAPEEAMASTIASIYESGGTVEAAIEEKERGAHEASAGGDEQMAATLMLEAARLELAREGGSLERVGKLADQAVQFDAANDEVAAFAESVRKSLHERSEPITLDVVGEDQDLDEGDQDNESGEPETLEFGAEPVEQHAPTDADGSGDAEPSGEGLEDDSLAADGGGQTLEGLSAVSAYEGTLDDALAVLEDDPADIDALAFVRRQLREDRAYDELAEHLENSLKYLRKQEGELEVMVDLASLYWRELGDMERAEYYFKRVKLLDAQQPEMLAFFDDFYRREGQWRKLYALLSGRQSEVDDLDEARELSGRLARIAEVQMESPEKAIDVWKTFLRRWGPDPHARQELRRLYEENEKWNALVDFLKERERMLAEEGGETTGARVMILERMAEIYRDEIGLDAMVINTLQSILELEPDHQVAFTQLEERLRDGKRWNELAELLSERAEIEANEGQDEQAIAYLIEVADIWQEKLRNVTQALPHLERVIEIDPGREAVKDQLRDIYEKRRDYESLFDLDVAEARLLDDAAREERLEELRALAEEKLRDPKRLVDVLEELVALRPGDDELFDRLEAIHRGEEDHEALADLLERRAALTDDAQRRADRLVEAAQLRGEELGQLDEAAQIWRTVLDRGAEQERAVEALTDIYFETDRLDDLEELYAERDALETLHERLVERADAADQPERARMLRRRAADVAGERLEAPALAAEDLEVVVELSDDPRPVLQELDACYEAVGDLGGRIGCQKRLLDHAEPDEHLDLLIRLGRLEAERGDDQAALDWLLQAASRDPQRSEALELAEEVARRSEARDILVDHLELLCEQFDDEQIRADLWARLGRVLDEMGEPQRALEYVERLHERDPRDQEVLSALEGLYEQLEEPHKRVEALRELIELRRAEGAERHELVDQLSKIADVQRRHLDERDAARQTYHDILDIDPNHVPALRGIREMYREQGRYEEVVESLHRELSLLSLDEEDERIEALMALGDTLRVHLDDPREAIHQYGQVLAERPQHAGAVAAVEQLLSEPQLTRQAALMLEPIFRDAESHTQLARALEARREVSGDRFEEAEILDELIPLYADKLDETERAFEHACRQFELDPGREEVWLRVEQIGAKLDRWETIEELFSEHAPSGSDLEPDRVNLLRHLASIREHRLGRKEDALDTWEQLYAAEPTDEAVIDALERLYRQLERDDDLVEALEAKETLLGNDEERIDVLLEIAQLREEALDDALGAVDTYRRVLALQADHQQAAAELMRLYEDFEEWTELEQLYEDQADLAIDPDRRREFLLAQGRLRAEHLSDFAGAVELLGRLVTEDPGDDEAVEALEALAESVAEHGERPDLEFEIAGLLEPAYRSRREPAKLARVLETRVDHTEQPFEKVDLLDELVDMYLGRLEDPDSAYSALSRAVVADPENPGRRRRLLEVAAKLERLEAGAKVLEVAAADADPVTATEMHVELGALYEDRLQIPSEAIASYERALEGNEHDTEVLNALERLYRNTNDFEKLADILRRQTAFADPERRIELLERVGTILEEVLDRPEDALDCYAELLDEEPDSIEAFDALERLNAKVGRWMDVADVLRRRLEIAEEDGERVAILQRLADTYADQLGDRVEAVTVHREILSIEPDRLESLDALEQIFEEGSQWHELADILRRKLESGHLGEGDERIELELRLADLLREELYEVDEALGHYRAVLEETPGHAHVIEAFEELVEDESWAPQVTDELAEYYADQRDFEQLVSLYELRKDQCYEPDEKIAFLERIARAYRDYLDQPMEAIEAYSEAWTLDPSREDLHGDLLELVYAEETFDHLVRVYEEGLSSVSDPDQMLEFRMRLAELYVDKLDDPFEAETHYREVLNLEADNDVAFAALEGLLTEGERWIDLAELLERRADVVSGRDEDEAKEVLLKLAELQREELDDAFTAADVYRRVLDFNPTDPAANEALRDLYREQERFDDLAELLQRQIELSSEPDQIVALQRELADLKRTRLMEPRAALELYRSILEVEPDDPDCVEALEEMFETNSELGGEVAAALEPIYRASSQDERLVDVLIARADSARSEEMGREFLAEAAGIAERKLEDLERAMTLLGRVFELDPSERRTRLELHRVCSRSGQWERLTDIFADVLQSNFEVDDKLRADLLAEQAAMYETRLGQIDEALEAFSQVLLYEPDHEEAIDGVERLLVRQENWLDLAQFYRERAEVSLEERETRRWLERLATLYEEVLDDLDEAIAVYNELLELVPDDADVQRTLVRLYGHAERWHDLADLYRRRIEQNIDPDQAIDLRFELASLLESELDRIDEALAIYRDILQEAPDHPETMRAMEGLRRDLANRDGEWTAQRREIIEVLVDRYNERKHWRRIVDLLDEKQRMMSDADRQVDLLAEMADLIQRSADEEADKMQALMKLARAFCIDPTNDNLRERVAERADQLDAWEGVIQVFLRGLENTDDLDEQARILKAVGEAYAGPLDDAESAITAFQQVVDLTGDTDALTRLQHLYGELELWQPLVAILERRLDDEYDGEARSGLLRRIAMIHDDILDEPDEAIVYYEELRREDPSDEAVLEALGRMYQASERWIDLEEVLIERAELIEDDEQKIEVLRHLARVQSERLDEPSEAITTYRRLLDLDAEDVEAVHALSRLLEASERWDELIENLNEERDFAAGLDELNEIEMRMATVRFERLDRPEEALDNLSNILERDPHNAEARRVLMGWIDDERAGERAARILQEVYRASEEFDELERLFEERLESLDEPERRAEIYMELAQLYEEHHGSAQMAFMTLGRGLRDVPGVEFLRRELERHSRRLDNAEELSAVYEDTIEVADLDPDQEMALRKRLGDLFASELGDVEAALEHFEAAWRIDEMDVELLDRLDELYQKANRWEDLAMVLQNRLAVAEPEEINDVRFRLGYLHEVIFEDHREALELYREIILSEPEHGGVLEALGRMVDDVEVRREVCELLEPVYEDLGADRELAELLELKLDVADGPSERAELHRRIARLQMEALDSIYGGYAHLGRAFREDPHDVEVQERLEELAEQHELYDQLVALFEEVCDEIDEPVRRGELAARAADWAFEILEETDRAAALYRTVLEVDPEHDQALSRLETIAREEDRPQALEAVLRRKAERLFEPDERREALVELGRVRLRLEMFDGAIEAFEDALEIEPNDIDVLKQLVGLFEITERYEALVDILERLAELEEDPDEVRLLYVRIGQYCSQFLDRQSQAIGAYQRAHELAPSDAGLLRELEELYADTEQWANLVDTIDRQLELLDESGDGESEERLRLLVRRAQINYERFDETERAIEDFQAAFAIKKDSPRVVEALDELYRSEERWHDLMDLYSEQLQVVDDEDRLVDLHVEIADICHRYLDADERALEFLDAVQSLRPDHAGALDVLQSIHEGQGDLEAVVSVLERKASALESDERIAAIEARADVLEDKLGDPARAADALLEILEVDASHRETFDRLERIYKEIGAYDQLYELTRQRTALAENEDEMVEVFLKMADIAHNELGDPALRTEALERAYALRSDDLDIVEPLLDAYIANEDFEQAEPLLAEVIETLEGERRMKEVVRFEHLRGKLAEQMGDLDGARRAYEAAHAIDASHIPNLLSLGKLLVRFEEWDEALKIFQTLLLHQMSIDDPDKKVELYYNLGLVRLQQGEESRAKSRFNRALDIDPDHTPSKEALEQL